jgi:hypothetical protein
MILRATVLTVLSSALAGVLIVTPAASQSIQPGAATVDPTGPALVALAMREGPDALPSVADLLIGLPTPRGAATVCGRVTYEGRGSRDRRFVAMVDEDAMQHRQLALVRFEQTPGFERDWARYCRLGMS